MQCVLSWEKQITVPACLRNFICVGGYHAKILLSTVWLDPPLLYFLHCQKNMCVPHTQVWWSFVQSDYVEQR